MNNDIENYGAWETEPDHAEWTHEESGYRCEIRRVPGMGHLCGYVTLPPGHPVNSEHKVGHTPHGGVTYFEKEGDCHKAGFDCAHLHDYSPQAPHTCITPEKTVYRTFAYVKGETNKLALALYEQAKPHGSVNDKDTTP